MPPRPSRPSRPPRLLLIDNYDSFTYNLVQAFAVLGADVTVARNDRITVDEALAGPFTHLAVSPGPGSPRDAGVSMPLIEAMAGRVPILGVCLGHQAIAEVFGGRVGRAATLMHGKASRITHDGAGLFAGLPATIEVGRYHSLSIEPGAVPPGFAVSARADDGEIMGIRHPTLPIEGVQFHPESVLTPLGPRMLAAFLAAPQHAQAPEHNTVLSAEC